MRRINGLTPAVFMIGENRGLDLAYRPHMQFSPSPGDLPFEGCDGNFKVLQRNGIYHLYQKFLDEKFLKNMT